MRGRVVAAFALGFAIGAVCIGVALWGTGTLRTAHMPPWTRQDAPQAAPAPAVPDTSASAQLPPVPVPPPETPPTPAAGSQGYAERAATEAAVTPSTVPATLRPTPELQLAMPIAGIDPKTLTDQFNEARGGGSRKHEAIDLIAPRGTPVLAVAEGNVAKLFNSKDGGLTVYQFDNTQKYAFYYAHLDRYAPGIKEGMLLRKGDTLGFVGTTGDAPKDVPHLHFAVFKLGPEKQWWKGTALNPLPMLKP
jgi:murein DD-endopeptidase MepM/ murein hydrolase activator NlpD